MYRTPYLVPITYSQLTATKRSAAAAAAAAAAAVSLFRPIGVQIHPVSVLNLHPREMPALWSHTTIHRMPTAVHRNANSNCNAGYDPQARMVYVPADLFLWENHARSFNILAPLSISAREIWCILPFLRDAFTARMDYYLG